MIVCKGRAEARRSETVKRRRGPSGTPDDFGQTGLPLALLRGLAPRPHPRNRLGRRPLGWETPGRKAFKVAWGVGVSLLLGQRSAPRLPGGPSRDSEREACDRHWRVRGTGSWSSEPLLSPLRRTQPLRSSPAALPPSPRITPVVP